MSQSLPVEYEYQPLLESDSIRVLQLHPSTDLISSPQCDLISTRLCEIKEPEHSYAAISYVWGDERDSHTISIGSHPLTVGRNIHSALRQIRRRDRPIRLWVDAICINQFNLTERNHQVQHMRAIYSAAEETIIYLGDQDGGNTGISAWNFLERNSKWAMNQNHDVDYSIPARMERKLEFRGDLDDVEIDVLERPWFRRVWVFQEVVVSQNVTIQCGSRKIAWDEFCRILLLSPRYHDRYGFSIGRSGKIDVVRDMFHARCSYQEAHGMGRRRPSWHARVENYKGGDSNILNTLSRARQLEAFDPRDKIYALLGVSSGVDLDGDLIAVDYRKSCSQVYLEFTKHVMETTKSYDILSYLDDYSTVQSHEIRHSQDSRLFSSVKLDGSPGDHLSRDYIVVKRDPQGRKVEYLPSWVPNWDRGNWNIPSPSKFRYTGRTVLSSLGQETDIQTVLRKEMVRRSCMWPSTKILAAVGVIIGEVVERGPSIALVGNDELRFQDIIDRHHDEPSRMIAELIVQWRNLLNQGELTLELGNMLERRHPNPLYNIARLLSPKPNPPRHSVEYHLLKRGRKSVAWNDDNNKAVAVIRDQSSIVETKRVAAYQRFDARREIESEGLALVPSRTVASLDESKYLIVYLRGARVPFLVHQITRHVDLEDKQKVREGLSSTFQLENCTMFGECLVNGFDYIARDCELTLKAAEASAELSSGDLPPAWTPYSNARVFLIS
ncbi:hypothetical protein ONS95_002982 [Cadophora gregata]|uniref:uncharacterized protein n=1 Tax=Cadophora gregata TaxID=51156 RepID=UPI0026DC2ADA|nr:uncharacterized protein ONS95_002982 [Cadophora gregata]KAK0108160.1 hypothetical protein ONS95_002982 [Cadophora gregata]KAK0109247.1 hypothetical protein ONS96_003069 [Cadophora gregata f. sp. sojae]